MSRLMQTVPLKSKLEGLSVAEFADDLDIQDYERLETSPAPTKYEVKCAADAFGIREDQIIY